MTHPARNLIAPLLLAGALLPATAAAQHAPEFQLPFSCNSSWYGITLQHNPTPQAIEFTRRSYLNEPVLASAAGTISQVRDLGYGSDASRYVIIDHGNGWSTLYMNLATFNVAVGEYVAGGQPIATVGKTGPEQSLLYFEQRYYGMPESITIDNRKAYYWGSAGYTSNNCMQHHW